MPILKTNQCPIFAACKTLIASWSLFTMTNRIGEETANSPQMLAWTRNDWCPPFKLYILYILLARCLKCLLNWSLVQLQRIPIMSPSLRLLPQETSKGTIYISFTSSSASSRLFCWWMFGQEPSWQSDNNSYGSSCLEDKKFSCKRLSICVKEEIFHHNIKNNPKRLPFWAMLKIQVDLQHE